MSRTIWILADQLARNNSALAEVVRVDRRTEPARVLMIESEAQWKRLPCHKHRVMLSLSAMRHFAEELKRRGLSVDYYPIRAGGLHGHHSYSDALRDHLDRNGPAELVVMEPAEPGMRDEVVEIADACGAAIRLTPNSMFLTDRRAFAEEYTCAGGFRMESHYRRLRLTNRILIADSAPAGGTWIVGSETSIRLPDQLNPTGTSFLPDAMTHEVAECVEALFAGHPGCTSDFQLPVTHAQANDLLDLNLNLNLDLNLPLTLTSTLTFLDLGLLHAPQVLKKIDTAYQEGRLPLSIAEPLVREILGWREYRYGISWLRVQELQRRS
ncbi:MAG: cryptochrome/photolyase family protein [Bacteroidota bacterium]